MRRVRMERAEAVHVIEGLGGTRKAAQFFDISDQSVSDWRSKGIPKARLRHLRDVRPELLGQPHEAKDEAPPAGACSEAAPAALVVATNDGGVEVQRAA